MPGLRKEDAIEMPKRIKCAERYLVEVGESLNIFARANLFSLIGQEGKLFKFSRDCA